MLHKDTLFRADVYPNFRECSIQTFNDQDKNERSQLRILPMTEENLEKCVKLQEKLPYGIYFSVNPMAKWKRDANSVTKIQTWICDIDTWTKEEQLKLIENAPLIPSYVVESVHGFHIYYLAKSELTKEQYERWNLGLMSYYHWDIKVCKDTARVLRIPWYFHCKGEKQLVVLRDDLFCWQSYSYDQMLLAFPYIEEEEKSEVIIKPVEKKRNDDDTYRYKLNNLDNRMMLLELSGTRFVDYEIIGFNRNGNWTEQITINWVPKSCRLDKNWMIGSSDNGWPWWTNRVIRYYRQRGQEPDWADIAERVNANHPELEREKKRQKFDVKKVEKVEKKWSPKWFLYADEVFDEFECFLSWELVTIVAETNSWKTTFAMDLITRNTARWRKGLYINLEFPAETVWKNRWLWRHWKTKQNLSDLNPLSKMEEMEMNTYVKEKMKTFETYSEPNWMDLEDLEKLIYEKTEQWYELFIVDSLSRIHGNTDGQNSRGYQNKCMEDLQEMVQKLDIAIVLLHHTNKFWKFEWSQKIADLSNVFMFIQKEQDDYGYDCRKYTLYKDKFVNCKELKVRYSWYKYEKV